jgi:hypothetical protein
MRKFLNYKEGSRKSYESKKANAKPSCEVEEAMKAIWVQGKAEVRMERAGTRDIEGKVTRVGASKPGGERVSIKKM